MSGRLTLRQRLAVAAAVAVALSVALASIAAYVAVESRLRADIDDSLRDRAALVAGRLSDPFIPPDPGRLFGIVRDGAGPLVRQQLVDSTGATRRPPDEPALPVDRGVLAVAAGTEPAHVTDRTVDGVRLRMITAPVVPGVAIQVARPLDDADALLSQLRAVLIAVTLAGVVVAAILGWVISGRALRPVRRFTERTEAIAAAGDPGGRLAEGGDDELGRLARTFNATLDRLERSVETQRQLVADASHELRTPLASLRTNVEVLQRGAELSEAERREILRDVVEQTDELTNIVADVVDAARRGEPAEPQEVRADHIVAAMVERTRRIAPRLRVEADLEPWVVMGVPDRLSRLVANLLDNAAKWSPADGTVEVRLAGGVLRVRDHGPGIPREDLPHVFDRFYRATRARSLPGSGLGLAIVAQVAQAHGGRATAANAPDGGAVLEVTLPGAPPDGPGAAVGRPPSGPAGDAAG